MLISVALCLHSFQPFDDLKQKLSQIDSVLFVFFSRLFLISLFSTLICFEHYKCVAVHRKTLAKSSFRSYHFINTHFRKMGSRQFSTLHIDMIYLKNVSNQKSRDFQVIQKKK